MIFILVVISLMLISTVKLQVLTRSNGAPVGDNLNSETAGPSGPVLLQDLQLIEKLSALGRERIPERVVHARGTAAKGYFLTTADLSSITKANIFSKRGIMTPVLVRFSTVIHSEGSPETLRDPRGFAVKFYTSEGNWDLVGNNFPVFFIRDAKQFPDMVHSLKPDPVTNIQDPNRYFDFFSFKPEAIQMLTFLYSPLGIPANYRQMNGSSVHAYKFVNKNCDVKYVKFTWSSRQGVRGLYRADAARIQSVNFNHATQDLYENIQSGRFPIWDLYAQTIDAANINNFDFNPIDSTKRWPENVIPSFKVGELYLTQIPDNFFQTTEQSLFSPNNLVPGIEASEDRLLQGRIFSYADAQRYRLGINNKYLEPNRPLAKVMTPAVQDGDGFSSPKKGSVNYFPTNYQSDPGYVQVDNSSCPYQFQSIPFNKTQNFKQAGDYFRSLSIPDQQELIVSFGSDLAKVKSQMIREMIASYAFKANATYGAGVSSYANVNMTRVMNLASNYED